MVLFIFVIILLTGSSSFSSSTAWKTAWIASYRGLPLNSAASLVAVVIFVVIPLVLFFETCLIPIVRRTHMWCCPQWLVSVAVSDVAIRLAIFATVARLHPVMSWI